MHMTLEADYAVRIVACLVTEDQRRDAAYIAEKTQVPLRFALKILRKLVQGRLAVSFKGARGGYPYHRRYAETFRRRHYGYDKSKSAYENSVRSRFQCRQQDYTRLCRRGKTAQKGRYVV